MSTDEGLRREAVDVAVVGAGPAGLAAAAFARRAGAARVVVVDRESEPGGIPRHAHHQGFGARDLHRLMSGPEYGRRIAALADASGAELRTETQVTGWGDGGQLELTSASGRILLDARAVVLATGCRERPRSARLVPGSRPQGVMTTGMLQQLVYLRGEKPGRRAVVIGAEHVSFSALLTLAHGGARAVAMTTEHPRHQSSAAFRVGAALRFRTPLFTRTALSDIRGRQRVEAVELTNLENGQVREEPCDLVVFTADWIPDHELAVLAGADLDPLTRGPAVDAALRTSRPGLFAAGNVLHGAETADVAALAGHHVAASVVRYLEGDPWPEPAIPIHCVSPLGWIVPNAVSRSPEIAPPRSRYLLRASERLASPRIEITQGDRRLWSGRLRRVEPGRSTRLPTAWAREVDPADGPVTLRLLRTRG